MGNQVSNGAADGHQQSIGEDDGQVVDGIQNSHPGTQEPSGAHIDAGDPGPAAGHQPEPAEALHDRGVRAPTGSPSRGLSGMNGNGVAQPGNTTGALGSHAQDRMMQQGDWQDSRFAGNWTGSVVLGGKAVGVMSLPGKFKH